MVFFISVMPLKGANAALIPHADKILHFAIYAITCALFWSGLKKRAGRWALHLSVLLATAYGYLMEIAQGMVGYRSFSHEDIIANFLGALAAAIFIWTKRPIKTSPDKRDNEGKGEGKGQSV